MSRTALLSQKRKEFIINELAQDSIYSNQINICIAASPVYEELNITTNMITFTKMHKYIAEYMYMRASQ